MKRFRLPMVMLALAALAFGAFAAFRMMQPPPDDLDLSRSKASAANAFVVSIEPEGGAVKRGPLHAWIVTVTGPDSAPVAGATIKVDGGMPQHGHGLPTEPVATALPEAGKYRIEGMKFNMGGWWVLRLEIDAAGQQDHVEFNIVL
ncbi:MAG TPA: FixH family protein [Rhizobiaceae bacterium]|nr:FixH family protein [Rhizobiaceae bacterium]